MLSGETAVGKHPVLAVEVMRRTALATEESLQTLHHEPRPPAKPRELRARMQALAHAAWHMARDVDASICVVWSQDGEAARYLSRNGFEMPIIAFTSDPRAQRRMALYYAVRPVLMTSVPVHRSELARVADRYILEMGLAKAGERVILLGGKPFDDPASVNTLALRTVGETLDTAGPGA